jgi:iron complex outermembrane receptor protein
LGYNYNETEIDRVAPNPPSLTAIDPTALRFGRVELARFEVGAPRDKFLFGGVWQVGGWSLGATTTRYGEFSILNARTDGLLDQTFDAKWLLDVSASYTLQNWEFTFGGDNVTDAYPDEVLYQNSTNGQLIHPSQSPFGFNGAYYYGRVAYTW